ncbi:hypothetical protein ABC255_16840 [Neobacillus sp. 3P2-tot-E-2]|uniref:hypothetical protein n=1 Tax=Neobacillus sp. 3P2-tot-E-2 TaxID=3132212 RepID=UPI00399FB8D3
MNEKRDKFERLAEKRVTDVIKKVRLIGNLSNKNNYDYNDEHVKQIIDTLESEVRLLKGRFKEEKVNDNPSFSFKK